jgi:hypothetical protein
LAHARTLADGRDDLQVLVGPGGRRPGHYASPARTRAGIAGSRPGANGHQHASQPSRHYVPPRIGSRGRQPPRNASGRGPGSKSELSKMSKSVVFTLPNQALEGHAGAAG